MKQNSLCSDSAKQVCVEAHSRCFNTPGLCDMSHLSFLYTEKKNMYWKLLKCALALEILGLNINTRYIKITFSVMRWVCKSLFDVLICLERDRLTLMLRRTVEMWEHLWKTHLQLQGGLIAATLNLHSVLLLQGNDLMEWSLVLPINFSLYGVVIWNVSDHFLNMHCC